MNKKELLRHLRNSGIPSKIVDAFVKVDRRKFVSNEFRKQAYLNEPFYIGYGQTTSQPYTIAFMLTLLEIDDGQKILEIGSGRGYVLELLANLNPNGEIIGIERIKELADESKELLKELKNVEVIHGDGTKGILSEAPFDRILASASFENIPQQLVEQLRTKGVLVSPVRDSIVVVKRDSGINKISDYPGFVFVPIVNGVNE